MTLRAVHWGTARRTTSPMAPCSTLLVDHFWSHLCSQHSGLLESVGRAVRAGVYSNREAQEGSEGRSQQYGSQGNFHPEALLWSSKVRQRACESGHQK